MCNNQHDRTTLFLLANVTHKVLYRVLSSTILIFSAGKQEQHSRALFLIVINPLSKKKKIYKNLVEREEKKVKKMKLCKFSSNNNYLTFLMTFLNGKFFI